MPRGTRSRVLLAGPAKRHVAIRTVRKLKLPVGRYKLRIPRVRITGNSGRIKRGAVASPVRKTLHVTVRSGKEQTLDVRYGTIVNPGVRGIGGKVARVLGDPANPHGLVLASGAAASRGQILSVAPSAQLPHGLLARVTSVSRRGGDVVLGLEPAGIYEVAPNMTFDVPLSAVENAAASKLVKCVANEISPSIQVSDFHLTGGWTTTHVLFTDIKTGANVELHYRVSAGVSVTARLGRSCSLDLPEIGIQGMAGPIPVYGGFRPTASAELAAAATLQATGSVDVTTGVKIGGVPPTAKPIVNFSSPRFTVTSQVFAGLKASLGLDAELGIGAENAANLHADIGTSLDLTVAPGNCSWDLNLGTFSATGEIGPLTVTTPTTGALYHHNLWSAACGAPPSPPPPTPAPSPVPAPSPPPVTLPLLRAAMSWDTDSDIDLYSWDERGDEAYFGNRYAIPEAELIKDIIPDEFEFGHEAEFFQELGSPNRRYTFGICDYRGYGADVLLTVADPGGTTRSFPVVLTEPGDGAVITTSPLGVGYYPQPGWCRHVEESEFEEEEFE